MIDKQLKRIVIKVGTAVLTEQNRISKERMQNLVDFIVDLKEHYEVILVSSGAVAAGYGELKVDKSILANKQALASIGQPILMHRYQKKFERFNIIISQILVTSANFESQMQSSRIKNMIEPLISNNVLPIVNENDATATEELEVGDNDQLSAYTAELFNADMLVILSDIDAYYDKDPNEHTDAQVIKHVQSIEQAELEKKTTANHKFATGGIVTKLKAANYLMKRDISMFLASGFDLRDVKNYLLKSSYSGGTIFKKLK